MLRGSRNPKIFGSSYQPPIEKKPLSVNHSWRAIITIVALVALVLLIGRLPLFQIKTTELLGDKNDTTANGLHDLQGKPLFSRAVNNFVSKIQAEPSVDQFTCRKGIPSSLRCTISLRTPVFVWQSGQSQYLVDKTGIIFSTSSSEQTDKLVVEDTLQQPIELGRVIVSPEIVTLYQQLVAKLAEKQIITKRLLLSESLYQVTALIDRPGKSSVKGLFLLTDNIQNQVDSISAVLAQKGDSITDHIDARVSGYIYSK